MPRMPVVSITLLVVLAILLHNLPDRLLEWLGMVLGCQRQYVSPVPKQLLSDSSVDIQTLWDGHA